MRTGEQILHDRINLPRLMKRLEQSIQEDDWTKTTPPKRATWMKAQATLQTIRHAQLLLKNVEVDNVDPSPAEERRYQQFRTTLEHLEDYMLQVEQQTAPPVRRPKPLLQSIRPPPIKSPQPTSDPTNPSVEATLIPAEIEMETQTGLSPLPDVNNLIPASEPEPEPEPAPQPSHSTSNTPPGPSFSPPSTSNITATPTLLQNSRAMQEELSEQLALMATQLRRNATHLAESLQKDKTVIESMHEKLEGNLDFMQRQRIRLRDFRGKSGGTTCLVIMSVVVVLVAFIFMVFVIRLT